MTAVVMARDYSLHRWGWVRVLGSSPLGVVARKTRRKGEDVCKARVQGFQASKGPRNID